LTEGLKVLVPDTPAAREIGPVPPFVELVTTPEPAVEFVVLGLEFVRELPGFFDAMPSVRVVQSLTAGVDWVIPKVPRGVVVAGASGAHDISVSEWVLAVLLALQRRLPDFLELQRRGEWDSNLNDLISSGPSPLAPIRDLDGSEILIVGHGSIGRSVAARLAPFGARITGIAKHARTDAYTMEALPGLLPKADVVVILAPLTDETERLVDDSFLEQLKPGALLINASRGALVDTEALIRALELGRVRAALDVTDPEPLPSDHALWRAPNVLITPHVAGAVERWQERAYRVVGDQIRRYAAGEALLNVASG
jgi:phosphoglycerate dehydrogenase-like enzyme